MSKLLSDPQKRYTFFTHAFFAVMTVFAIVFANERFQADGAYYLFRIVNFETFQVEHQRFVLVFSQALPLLGVKLGLSLKAIIILNSLSNIIFFYLIFRYVVYYLRDQTAGIAVILFQVLGVLHLNFTPMYEVWYGAMLLVPIRAHLVCYRYNSMRDILFLIALMITVLFAHPLLFIPLIFVLLLDAVEKWALDWRVLFSAVFVFTGWIIVKKMFISPYEAGKVSMLDTSWNKAYLDLISASYYWGLIKFFFTFYTIPVLIYIVTLVFYLIRRSKTKALLVSGFFIGHILVVNFTHVNDVVLTPYFERMYMSLIPIVLFPFLYDVITQIFLRNIVGASILFLIIAWRIGRFVDLGLEYKDRTALAEKAIEQAWQKGGSKFQLHPSDSEWCMNWADWSLAMETQIRSAAVSKDKTVAISIWSDFEEPNNKARLASNPKLYMMRCYDLFPEQLLNQKYFHVQHGFYQKLDEVCH